MAPLNPENPRSAAFDPARLELVVFDFDGTLAELNIDFGEMRRLVNGLAVEYGLDLASSGQPYVLEAIEFAVGQLGPRGADFRAGAEELIVGLELASARAGRLFPGVRESLAALGRSGLERAVITRNCRRAVETIFPDLYDWCELFLPRDDVERPKPAPEHLAAVLERLGKGPGGTLMVGDHPMDVATGRALGAQTCGLPTGRMSREELFEADVVFDSLGELVEVLVKGRG